MNEVTTKEVASFWNANPLCASSNPYPRGSKQYFQYYDQQREAVETPEFSSGLHEYDNASGKRVPDVGCGNGYVLSRYAQRGAQTTGIDITENAIALSRQRFELWNLSGSFVLGNAETLPFTDGSFDYVCSMGVLHHVPDTGRAVAEIHRVMKRQGRLIVMLYHRDSALYRWNMRLRSWITGKSVQQLLNEYDGIGNPKGWVYSREELRSLLRDFTDAQMSIGHLQGYMLVPGLGAWEPRWLTRLTESRWGFFLYAKARKA